MRPRDHVDGGDRTNLSSGSSSGINCRLHRTDFPANDYRNQPRIHLLVADQLDVRGFHHRIRGLDHCHKAETFDHSKSLHIYFDSFIYYRKRCVQMITKIKIEARIPDEQRRLVIVRLLAGAISNNTRLQATSPQKELRRWISARNSVPLPRPAAKPPAPARRRASSKHGS